MDKIFREIKKAIEEEMRNAESGPPPGGGRPQGGRRAQEYSEWLKEEQKRLRGDQQQEVYQPEELQEVPVEEARAPQARRPEQGGRPQRSGNSQKRDRSAGSRRQQHERQSREQQSQQSSGERPAERAQRLEQQERRRQRGSEPKAARVYRNRIERQLKSPGGLRMAFLMREIVGKPVSLRDKDDHLIS